MYTRIDDPIRVMAEFGTERMRPVWFEWNHERHAIREITFCWQEKQGQTKFQMFSVTDGSNTYEISYNKETMRWTLSKVCTE